MSVTLEYSLRKFMYYRLLSMRVLVDWENRKVRRRGWGVGGNPTDHHPASRWAR